MKITALIPARSGSVRIKDKNIKNLGGHPLITHTINNAKETEIFDRILLLTDSEKYRSIGVEYGAECPELRPELISDSNSPDIEWVEWAIKTFNIPISNHAIAILRPTSPFRTAENILEAWKLLQNNKRADSIRAVSEVDGHPGKMWTTTGEFLNPLFPFSLNGVPWHSNQKPALPKVYIQNASLEIVYTEAVIRTGKISGDIIIPFHSNGYEGFDINDPIDFDIAEVIFEKYIKN